MAQLTELWTVEQALYLLFAVTTLLTVIGLIAFLYGTSMSKWPSDNVKVEEESYLNWVLLAKPTLLLLSAIVIYFPFRKKCMNHPKGVFFTPRLFLYQIFEPGMGPSLYFAFPVVFFIFDFYFYIRIKQLKVINKSGGLGLSIFTLCTVPLFVYETIISSFDLIRKDHQPGYCRLDSATTHFLISHAFLIIYQCLLAVQTVIICRMTPNIDLLPSTREEESNHVATLLSTQTTETRIESEYNDMVYIFPRPFSVPQCGSNVLNVKNNRDDEWVILRVLLSTTGFYKVYPSKFFIPPGRQISMEVSHVTHAEMSPNVSHNLLLEWFTLPDGTIDMDSAWDKPYKVPQSKWQYFVLPVYLDDSKYG